MAYLMRPTLSLLQVRSVRARLQRYFACARGVTAIEFAFVAPMVIAILIAAMQIATLFIAQSYLEAVTEVAKRIVLTNVAANDTQAQFNAAVCNAANGALFNCGSLIIDLEPIDACGTGTLAQVTTCLNNIYQPQFNPITGALTNQPNFNVGNTGNKMRLLVMYQWPIISGPVGMSLGLGGTRLLSATEIFYKESCINSNLACVNNNG
jgi:Flp pilus assembly protein TadG